MGTLEDTEDTEDMVWDTLLWDTLVSDTLVSDTEVCMEDTEDTDMGMASVRLRLSPRLMLRPVLIPTTLEDTEDTEVCTEDTVYTDTDSASRISSRRTIGRIVGE